MRSASLILIRGLSKGIGRKDADRMGVFQGFDEGKYDGCFPNQKDLRSGQTKIYDLSEVVEGSFLEIF